MVSTRKNKNQNKKLISQRDDTLNNFIIGKDSHTGVAENGTVRPPNDDHVDDFGGTPDLWKKYHQKS